MSWPECAQCYRPTAEFNERWAAGERMLLRWGTPLLFAVLLTGCVGAEIMMPSSDAIGWIRCLLGFLFLALAVGFFSFPRMDQGAGLAPRLAGVTVLVLYLVLCLSAALVWSDHLETTPQRETARWGSWIVVGLTSWFLLGLALQGLLVLAGTEREKAARIGVTTALVLMIVGGLVAGGFGIVSRVQTVMRETEEKLRAEQAQVFQRFTQLKPEMTTEEVSNLLGKPATDNDRVARVKIDTFCADLTSKKQKYQTLTPPAFPSDKIDIKAKQWEKVAWAFGPYGASPIDAGGPQEHFIVIVQFRDGKLVHATKTERLK